MPKPPASHTIPFAEPDPAGSERARQAKALRDLATEVSRLNPQVLTRANGEEADHAHAKYPANFTKGLAHDCCGLLANPHDYRCFVEAINSSDRTIFEKHITRYEGPYAYATKCECDEDETVKWRGWESPRAGHVFELEGPDSGSVGMAPAPRVGSSELAAEMAEVYALAILRDVPFTELVQGKGTRLCGKKASTIPAKLTAAEVAKLLNSMKYFSGKKPNSSTPLQVDGSGLNRFERNRRGARTRSATGKLEPKNLFRGSTWGAHQGPYLSQFLLMGGRSLAGKSTTSGGSKHPGVKAQFDFCDGLLPYGSLVIDQRTLSHKNCLDYMTDWDAWLDVQNGADFSKTDQFESHRRFITTPRDLATYVHFDALYEAYLNAALVLLGLGVPKSKGFPEPSPTGHRTAFATFGDPHILSLVTEVATRCLKAVRRQKFNYHRRARPEVMGGRFTLLHMKLKDKLGCAEEDFAASYKELPKALRDAVVAHNADQNKLKGRNLKRCPGQKPTYPCGGKSAERFAGGNLLLPMAFPEGSPMHPAYGAGHATVAGGCITMLKAFFEMFENCNEGRLRKLETPDCEPICFVPTSDGCSLEAGPSGGPALTIQGELDKLAANISIGRNMAGVHYYSDYYDSLRMGERIAVGILAEQAPTYGDRVQSSFTSFDGDHISITGEAGSRPTLSILNADGTPVAPADWWLRHASGREFSEDL